MFKKQWWKKPDLYIGFGALWIFLGPILIFPVLNNLNFDVPLFFCIALVLLIVSLFLKRILIFFGFFFGYALVALIDNAIAMLLKH